MHRKKKATILFGTDQSIGLVAWQFAPIDFVWPPLGIDLSIQDSVTGCVPDGVAHSVGDRCGNLTAVLQIDDVESESLAAVVINTISKIFIVRADA